MRIFLSLCLVFLVSCGGEPSKQQPVISVVPQPAVTTTGTTMAAAVGEVTNARDSVVFFHIYASWCGPCVEEFPDVVELANRYKKLGLKVVAISTDEDADELAEFLRPFDLAFPAVRVSSSDAGFNDAIASIGANFEGGIPFTAIYDRTGKLVTEWKGSKDLEHFEKIIQPLL